eukprot:TRINITY_DN2856_c0_g1_i2.p1 TRINITY_DN2856_c0_g1~~TRINITY_DN2856_c0_g1_i2.p1  ORF type:complete len:827 (+),score=264.16 TRINITY_DN2856_c0_g1_i2:338-2482(+)
MPAKRKKVRLDGSDEEEGDESGGDDDLQSQMPPWITDSSVMSPLFLAYDNKIHALQQQIKAYSEEAKRVEEEVSDVVAENESLMQQLKSAQRGFNENEPAPSLDQWKDLKENIAVLEQQSGVMQQQEQLLISQVTDLKKNLADVTTKYEEARVKLQHITPIAAENEQTKSQLMLMDRKRASLEEQLRTAKSDLTNMSALKIELEQVKAQRDAVVQENKDLASRENSFSSALADMQKKLTALNDQKNSMQRELKMANVDRDDIFKNLEPLQKKLSAYEQREAAAIRRADEAQEQLEEERILRQKAELARQQAEAGEQRAAEALATEAKKLKESYTSELATAKAQLEAKTSRLQGEVAELQVACASGRADVERAKREKRGLEDELEHARRAPDERTSMTRTRAHDTEAKLMQALRERDAALSDSQRAEADLAKLNKLSLEEKDSLCAKISNLQQRLSAAEQQTRFIKAENVRLAEAVEQANSENAQLAEERQTIERSLLDELAVASKTAETQITALQQRQVEMETAHRQSVEQYEQLLAAQQSMRSKWKEELSGSALRFRRAVKDLETQKSRLQDRCDELQAKLSQAAAQHEGAAYAQLDAKRAAEKLQLRCEGAERKAMDLARAEQELVRGNQMLAQENMRMAADLDKAAADATRARKELATSQSGGENGALRKASTSLRLQLEQATSSVEALEGTVARLKDERRRLLAKLDRVV